MPVPIDDITPDFLAFWDRAEGRPVAEQWQLWREAYEEPHRTCSRRTTGARPNRTT